MALVGKAKLNHPALGTAGGATLHESIENLFTSISDQLGARWKLYSSIANGTSFTFEHGFNVPLADLRLHIYTSSAGVQTRLTDTTGWTFTATSGFEQTKIDVTVPSSGGPFTFYLYVSHEPMSDKLSLSGGTMTGDLVLNADPDSAMKAATKQYVDNLAQGLDVKYSVKAATTGNITLSGTQTIDGVSVTAGDRVLVKNQSSQSANGIYVVAAGGWTRALDMDSWGEVPGAFCFVEEGTVNKDTGWVCTADVTGTIGTTAMAWSQFAGVGTYTADGQGIELTGTQFSLELDGNSLSKSASGLKVNPSGDVLSGSLSSGVINATGYQDYTGISTPASPASGKTRVYAKTDGKLYTQSPAGIESAVGSGGSILLINKNAHGFVAGDVGCPVYVNGSGDYVKARADVASTAEVAGLINRIVDVNNFEVCLGGEVTSVGANAAASLTVGELYFLSPTTAGALTATEPTTLGHVSKPIGIARTASSISFFNMRGTQVGGVNARTEISLPNAATQNIYNAATNNMDAGELTGWIIISGTTSYRFYVAAQFAKNGANTDWNVSYQTTGDTPPAGFTIAMANTGWLTVTLPTIAGYSSAKFNYAVNGPAVGATFALAIDSTKVAFSDIQAGSASGITFKEDGGTSVGSVSDAGAWTFGPTTTTPADVATPLHRFNGFLYGAPGTAAAGTQYRGLFGVGANIRFGGASTSQGRFDSLLTGSGVVFEPTPTSNGQTIFFLTNNTSDTTSTNASTVGVVTAAGAWVLGKADDIKPCYKQYSASITNLSTSNSLVTSDGTHGNWMISVDCINGGSQMFAAFQVSAGIENGVTARYAITGTGGNCSVTESSEGTFDVSIIGITPVLRIIFGTGGTQVNVRTVSGTIASTNIRMHRFV